MMKFLVNFFITLIICCHKLTAQVTIVEDSLQTSNIMITNLSNDVASSRLNSRIQYRNTFNNIELFIKNDFISDVTKLNTKFFRDYEVLDFNVRYKISKNFSIGPGTSLRSLSDDRNIELNKNLSNFFYSSILYKPVDRFEVHSRIGYLRDDQIGEVNTGFKGVINSSYTNFVVQDYNSNAVVNLNYEKLTQKNNYNYEFLTDVYKNFSGFAENLASVKAYTNRADLFFPASLEVQEEFGIKNNTESRLENFLLLEDKLRYLVSEDLLLGINGSLLTRLSNREIKYKTYTSTLNFDRNYDASVNELSIRFSGELEYRKGISFNKLRLLFAEVDENHKPKNLDGFTVPQIREIEKIERNKNFSSKITTLSGESLLKLSDIHSVSLTGSASILRYDTNSDDNFDDRDEQYFIAEIKYIYDNLRNFKMETSFDVNRSTLRYLFSERSSNNSVNTIYRLTIKNVFRPFEPLMMRTSFQVSANYTVYDFEDLLSQVQSFSYRQMTLRDSLKYFLSEKAYINVFGEYKLSEQGEYNDREFTIRPLSIFDDRYVIAELNYFFYDFVELFLGYRFYQQMRSNYVDGERRLVSTFRNYGPLGGLRVQTYGSTYLKITGGMEILKFDNRSSDNTSGYFTVNIFWDI